MIVDKPVKIIKVIRPMRGGSQSFLVRAADGCLYVAKFAGNPQGTRTLLNEFMAGHLLSALHVATPDLAVLRLTESCEGREQLYFASDRHEPIINGLHLGSKCPVDPDTVTVFDFLPRQLYSRVSNLHDAGIVFAFDCWVAHADKRQFIYARGRRSEQRTSSKGDGKASLTAWAIDNGYCFGRDWHLTKLVLPTSHPSFEIYSHCSLEESALTGAKLIQGLPLSVIQSSYQQIPRDWFSDGDQEELAVMLDNLQHRQQEVITYVAEMIAAVIPSIRRAS